MRRLASLAVLTILALPVLAAARTVAPATPPAQILALAQSIVDAANANDPSKLAGRFTDDAIIIDENAPFRWTGAGAGVAWWTSAKTFLAERRARLHATPFLYTEYRQSGNAAYLIQPLAIAVRADGKTRVEHGTQTYTFRNTDGTWKISSAAWTKKP